MTTGLVLLTHEGVGVAMMEIAAAILGQPGMAVQVVEVPHSMSLEQARSATAAAVDALAGVDQLLVLVDLYGATPSNVGMEMLQGLSVRGDAPHVGALVAGLNLPMLLRVLNDRERPLAELVERATQGGTQGIVAQGVNSGDVNSGDVNSGD
ncbi:MAG: hypothetical protein KDK91_08940, partial [Gammaproteobacteria bacterium]|nr:hypothetical protein [Gammaproteobacteria bacterium]